jgi:DNA primase
VALYTRDSIERLRDTVDMVDLVSTKTDLRRVGSRWQGLCPFHDERSPSFNVNAEEKLYICFGCEAKGDSIRFVEESEGLDFREAVEHLAERYNVELQLEDEDPQAEERRRRRERLLALLERVSRFYATYLWDAAEAAKARDYLAGRGLSEETLREFRVGYAPSAWDRVTVKAQQDGYKPEDLVAAGVGSHGRNGGLYDSFRGRIMFPLADYRGHVRGFGARVLGEGRGPKYLNTSENSLFHKGRQLFGIDIARHHAAKSGRVVVVEGYTDVLALHQAGIRETVAIMGTALTPDQLEGLGKAAPRVVLALDADRSGQEAMVRAARAAKDVELQVVEMPEGSDPADLIAASGADAFEQRLGTAIEVQRFQLRRVLADADLDSTSGRDKAIEEARVLIASTPERSALRIDLVREAADRLDVPENYVTPGRGDVPRVPETVPHGTRATPSRSAGGPNGNAAAGPNGSAAGAPARSPGAASLRPERAFLALCLASGDLGLDYLGRLEDQHLSSGAAARARGHLAQHFDDPLAGLPEDDPQVGQLVASVVAEAAERGPATDAELRLSFFALELHRIKKESQRAVATGDKEAQVALAKARLAAQREIESIQGQTE